MGCHNGAAAQTPYEGPGLENPHPFEPADKLSCVACHGGDERGVDRLGSHVPPPPEIGDAQQRREDLQSHYHRLTLAGVESLGGRAPDEAYPAADDPDNPYTNLDYLQFLNPGDLRVVRAGRGCGAEGCHEDESHNVVHNLMGGAAGIFSGARFARGIDNRVPESRGRSLDGDSLADVAALSVENPAYDPLDREVGEVGRVVQQREEAGFFEGMRDNALYDADNLQNSIIGSDADPRRPNRVRGGSSLETLLDETTSILCGSCHLGNAGQNRGYGAFRGSGCTSCHMVYSSDGRYRGQDPNIDLLEPANPDQIEPGERPHVESHTIRAGATFLGNGAFVRGIDERGCVGCHSGSGQTVLQYWGMRANDSLLIEGEQYPADSSIYVDGSEDPKLHDLDSSNGTFAGRLDRQIVVVEDYDGDGRDDTPSDVHYEAGMGCIDCHGAPDLHGAPTGQRSSTLHSRQSQAVKIRCESCHGGGDGPASVVECETYEGDGAECVTDADGNPLRHVTRDANGDHWLTSRIDLRRHYVPQVRDKIIDNGRLHPVTQRPLYSPKASYAMGRVDDDTQTGTGPVQDNPSISSPGSSHLDSVECVTCHASWTTQCVGCHLTTTYDVNPRNFFFSNITGERILLWSYKMPVYQTPVPFYLGVGESGKLTQLSPAGRFFKYEDLNGDMSPTMALSDRLGEGNNPGGLRSAFPALSHYSVSPHTIRGRATRENEGPRYCVSCHYTEEGMDEHGDELESFVEAYRAGDFGALDYELLAEVIGRNTGNQLNHPIWVRAAAGLGSGLFLFDENGCPVNPLDTTDLHEGCEGAPADHFDPGRVVYDLDRLVEETGQPNSSGIDPRGVQGGRGGSSNPEMVGPLGTRLLRKLADPDIGIVLDGWLDADGEAQGSAQRLIE